MPKVSITEEQFKEKMTQKYGYTDFSTLVFKASKTILACIKCGKLNQKSALRHIDCTCASCFSNMSQRSGNSEFIEKVEAKFGNGSFTFDELNYTNAITPVTIYCTSHNGSITITPNKLLSGKGCNHCNKNHAHTTESFIEICKENYGNQFTFEKTVYVNRNTKVILHCTKCTQDWVVDASTILRGKTGCGECANKTPRDAAKFATLGGAVHNNYYDYSAVQYVHSENKVDIICPKHGVFHQQPKAHLAGKGCPGCGKYGYQPNEPGTFYIQKLVSGDNELYKFGISGNINRRISEQSRHSIYEHELIVEMSFDDGEIPKKIEREIKESIIHNVITRADLESGFTETFDESELEQVLEILKKYEGEQ